MTRLLVAQPPPAETDPVSRIGGRPLAPAGIAWPRCKSCKDPMQFLAQLRLFETGGAGLPDRLLLIFMCQNRPGMCDDWSATSGANCALLVPPAGAPLAPPGGKHTLLSKVDGVGFDPIPVGQGYPDLVSDPRVLGRASGDPLWIQADDTPECACGKRMSFVAQLEDRGGGGINFGDAGVGYAFLCTPCLQARFLWQCG